MKKNLGPKFGEYAKIFDYVRRQNEIPKEKAARYTFEPARRPDMMLAPRPRADLKAADLAMREIREFATNARELYRDRRRGERPAEARDYVRHQLALGLLDAPSRKPITGDFRFEDLNERLAPAKERSRGLFGFLRRKRPAE
jgi:hypothetical protein